MLPTTLILLLSAKLGLTQFVSAPKNLTQKQGAAGVKVRYKEVPAGICELRSNVKSYSGYADVAEDQHIFWWFFEARNTKPSEAPLTVWINGGPGSASMIGLFQELGPCGVDYDGNVYDNPYSWSNVSNMIFIDQPTTTGLSYNIPLPGYTDPNSGDIILLPDNNCPDYAAECGTYNTPNQTLTANSTVAAAPNFWKTLQGFMGAFPEYSQNGFFFATESYGGHYGPIFSQYILDQNDNLPNNATHIDLRATLIGNGWFDPILQYEAYYNFTTTHPGNYYKVPDLPYNTSNDNQVHNSMWGRGNCYDMLIDCNRYAYASNTSDGQGNEICSAADTFCYNNIEYPFDIVTGRDEYDIRYLAPDPFPYNFYVDYLNLPRVQEAIGAFTNYSDSSSITGDAFAATGDDARETGVTKAVEALIGANVTTVLYFGDADYVCNWVGGEAFSYRLSNVPAYVDRAGFVNISSSDGVHHGQVKSAGKFSFVRIYESGHEVPFYQPLVALEMFNRTIHGYDIATGKTKLSADYITKGPKMSTTYHGSKGVTTEVVPDSATYNTTTDAPNPYNDTSSASRLMVRNMVDFGPKPHGVSSRHMLARRRSEQKRYFNSREYQFGD